MKFIDLRTWRWEHLLKLVKNLKWEQVVPKIPWGHHVLILKKVKDIEEALFYVLEIIENNWSRAILEYQITSDLFNRASGRYKKSNPY